MARYVLLLLTLLNGVRCFAEPQNLSQFFVYGTLMDGGFFYKKYIKKYMVQVEPAIIRGSLYYVNGRGYPALLPGKQAVYGNIITLSQPGKVIFSQLDRLECYNSNDLKNSLYIRVKTQVVSLMTHKKMALPVYVYNTGRTGFSFKELSLIKSGRWSQFNKRKEVQHDQRFVLSVKSPCG